MTATFWDKRSATYDRSVQKDPSFYDKTIDSLGTLLNESDVVLDFACATGELSVSVAPYVQRVQGIDLSSKMIESAKQKARDRQVNNVSFQQGEVFDSTLEDGAFSVVMAFYIFHLVDEPAKVLARLNALLPSGGLLISKTPCLGDWNWFLRSLVVLAQKIGLAPPIHSFRVADVEALITNTQFEIVETKIWDKKSTVQWIVAKKI